MKILIVGIGELGRHLAVNLSSKGHDIVAIDKDPQKCNVLSSESDVMVLNRDATDPSLYDEVELESFDVVIAATDRDEVNLFVAAVAREYGINRVIVVTRSEKAAKLINMLGLSELTLPSPVVSAKIVEGYIEGRYDLVPVVKILAGEYNIYAIAISSGDKSVGAKIGEIKKELPSDVMILAVFNGEEFLEPDDDITIEQGYLLIMLIPSGKEGLVESVLR
jgi:trk system potassium uptake protein TrkA